MTMMFSNRWNAVLLGLLPFPCAYQFGTAYGFAPVAVRRPLRLPGRPLCSTTAPDDTVGVSNSLDGVADFDEWFSANSSSGARVNNIRHALFDSTGRGLQFTSTKSSDLSKVAVVPRRLVLSVPFSDEDESSSSSGKSWDTDLSCRLWEECQKGKSSVYYG